jgi:hypothetical protein
VGRAAANSYFDWALTCSGTLMGKILGAWLIRMYILIHQIYNKKVLHACIPLVDPDKYTLTTSDLTHLYTAYGEKILLI